MHSSKDSSWQPTPCSCLETPRDRGACWATVHRVAKRWTWLQWISMHMCKDTSREHSKQSRRNLPFRDTSSHSFSRCHSMDVWGSPLILLMQITAFLREVKLMNSMKLRHEKYTPQRLNLEQLKIETESYCCDKVDLIRTVDLKQCD